MSKKTEKNLQSPEFHIITAAHWRLRKRFHAPERSMITGAIEVKLTELSRENSKCPDKDCWPPIRACHRAHL
ncbi:MAG: hypothetical protein KDB00_09655, partial [Planctomycetales bacterium]|nr:hypothetical protein [Planctomycetales bacterium]